MRSQPKHPWCKKVAAKDEKDMKSNWAAKSSYGWRTFLIMMTRTQNVLFLSKCFVASSSLSKILISPTAGGLGCPIRFHIFFILAFLVLGSYFFTPGVFWLRCKLTEHIATVVLAICYFIASMQNNLRMVASSFWIIWRYHYRL